MINFILFCLICIGLCKYNFTGIKCAHDQHLIENRKAGRFVKRHHIGVPHSRRSEDEYAPLRILLDNSQLNIDLSSDTEKRDYVNEYIIPDATLWVEKLLLVRPVSGNLTFPRPSSWCQTWWSGEEKCEETADDTCYVTTIPKSQFTTKEVCPESESVCFNEGGGVANTDTIIYISAQETGSCGPTTATLAFASTCVRNENDRPIFGYANLCPSKLDSTETDAAEIKKYIYVMVHELFHALGYSSSSFSLFRNPDLSTRDVVLEEFEERDHNPVDPVTKIVTETVLSVARDHFDCQTLNGVEIENGGGSGTAGSHPEQRIYMNDFMNGVIPSNPRFTDLTVAVMQDSGWYKANFTHTERQFWGWNAGCDFALEKCLLPPTSDPEVNGPDNHFCKTNNEVRCTSDRTAIGYCLLTTGTVASRYYYFDGIEIGRSETMDYCPYYTEVEITGTGGKTTNCLDSDNQPSEDQDYFGEIYGSFSACFKNNLRQSGVTGYTESTRVGKCYSYICSYLEDVTTVKILVSGGETTCSSGDEGEGREISGWDGLIFCPDIMTICPGDKPIYNCPQNCSGHGDLADCMCTCYNGWGGLECEYFQCEGINWVDEEVCNSVGNCTSLDICSCPLDHKGQFCEYPICFGKWHPLDNITCNYPEGNCTSPDVCTCDDEFIGKECEYDISTIVLQPEKWNDFGDAIVISGDEKCGVVNTTLGTKSIYMGHNGTRQIIQDWHVRGSFELSFYLKTAAGGGLNSDCEPSSSEGSSESDILIYLEYNKSANLANVLEVLQVLEFDDYEEYSLVSFEYESHFESRLKISQPVFVEGFDQWAFDSLDISHTQIVEVDHIQFIANHWIVDILEYLFLQFWYITFNVLLVLCCCCCCLCCSCCLWLYFCIFGNCMCRIVRNKVKKKKKKKSKVAPIGGKENGKKKNKKKNKKKTKKEKKEKKKEKKKKKKEKKKKKKKKKK